MLPSRIKSLGPRCQRRILHRRHLRHGRDRRTYLVDPVGGHFRSHYTSTPQGVKLANTGRLEIGEYMSGEPPPPEPEPEPTSGGACSAFVGHA